MIEELRLFKFGLISAELSFSPGFNVIIGETGAGKSLLLSSIDFLKGAKKTLEMAQTFGVEVCVLKEKSPSCGVKLVYTDKGLQTGVG